MAEHLSRASSAPTRMQVMPPGVVAVGIDKLRVSIPRTATSIEQQAEMHSNFEELKQEGAYARSAKGKAYRDRLSVRIGTNSVLLESSPNTDRHRYAFAAEFNPNSFSDEELAQVGVLMRRALGVDATFLLRQTVINRLDVNIDFALDLSGLLVDVRHKRGGGLVMRYTNGKAQLETLYVGGGNSDRRLRMYDKAQQLLHAELGPDADRILAALESNEWPVIMKRLARSPSQGPLWRMEVVNQPKGGLPMTRIEEFSACFDGIRLLKIPADKAPFDVTPGPTFVQLASHIGLASALQTLDANERRRFKDAWALLPDAEFWDSARYATCIRSALCRLSPIFPANTRVSRPLSQGPAERPPANDPPAAKRPARLI
jgi:hypothetical protein